MLHVPSLELPASYPHPSAIASFNDNLHGYEPEFWEFQYQTYRYLERMSNEALAERYMDIVRNMRALVSDDRHIIPIQSFLSSWYWYRKEHQTRLELFIREVGPPCLPPTSSEMECKIQEELPRPMHPNAGDVLFRYGNYGHIEQSLTQGVFRIRPASDFNALEGDLARQDEETSKRSYMPGRYARISTQDGSQSSVIGDVEHTVSSSDYYMLCVTCDSDPELFADFKVNACLVIKNVNVFVQRLQEVSSAHLSGWYFHHNPVQYFDPYEKQKGEKVNAGMSKDFRFAYQREYRFLWFPQSNEESDGFKFLKLGSLEDISEIHVSYTHETRQ